MDVITIRTINPVAMLTILSSMEGRNMRPKLASPGDSPYRWFRASGHPYVENGDEPMRNAFVAGMFLFALIAAPQPTEAQYVKPVTPDADDIARYNMASTEARRSFFAAAMSGLTPDQLQTFWAVYADYEKEKDALAMARTDLAKKYLDSYSSTAGLEESELTEIVNQAGALQKKNIDLRLRFFRIYSEMLNTRAAARFALIDDYETTAVRMNLFSKLPMPTTARGQ